LIWRIHSTTKVFLAMSWEESVSRSTRHEPGFGDAVDEDVR
jgi:hypothetical protein